MLLKMADWGDIERMPCFEREHWYTTFAEFYTDKSGKVTVPVL